MRHFLAKKKQNLEKMKMNFKTCLTIVSCRWFSIKWLFFVGSGVRTRKNTSWVLLWFSVFILKCLWFQLSIDF